LGVRGDRYEVRTAQTSVDLRNSTRILGAKSPPRTARYVTLRRRCLQLAHRVICPAGAEPIGRRFRPAPDTELGVDVQQMAFDGSNAQYKPIGDSRVRASCRHQPQHLRLSGASDHKGWRTNRLQDRGYVVRFRCVPPARISAAKASTSLPLQPGGERAAIARA